MVPIDEAVRESWWAPAGRLARWLLGAFTLVGGLTWVLINTHGPSPVLDLVVGVILAAGGVVLLMPHRVLLPGRLTGLVSAATALIGTAAGLLATRTQVCCGGRFAVEDRGWPFHWAQHGAAATGVGPLDPALAVFQGWTVDAFALTGDLLMWAYVGMLAVAVMTALRRRRG